MASLLARPALTRHRVGAESRWTIVRAVRAAPPRGGTPGRRRPVRRPPECGASKRDGVPDLGRRHAEHADQNACAGHRRIRGHGTGADRPWSLLAMSALMGPSQTRRGRVSDHVRRRLRSMGLLPAVLSAIRAGRVRCWSLHDFRVYCLAASDVPETESGQGLRRNAIDDVLLYRPFSARDVSLEDFLAEALRRLEQ